MMDSKRRRPAAILRGAAIRAGLWTMLGIGAVAVVWLGWKRAVPPAPDSSVDAVGPPASATSRDPRRPIGDPPAPTEPLWRTVAESSAAAKPPLGEGWSAAGRRLVDVANATAAAPAWREGDRFVVDIPQLNVRYDVLIDRVADAPARSRTARGVAMDADGQRRRVVVTVGPGRTFAYVDTAGGPYELVGDGRLGWLLPSSSMMAGVDFTEPDYVLVAPGRNIRDIRELSRGR